MIINNIEILDEIWYNGILGIIKGKDSITNEIKFYVGLGTGISQKEDIKKIVRFGTKYTPESFKSLLNWLEIK